MPIRRVSVFLTPNVEDATQAEVGTFPDPVTADIIEDEKTGQILSIDLIIWEYVSQPPPESGAPPFPEAPAPEQVTVTLNFPPERTPYLPPLDPSFSSLMAAPIEAEIGGFEMPGVIPITPNEPRLDAATAPEGEPQLLEQEDGFEYLVREYKYDVALTTLNNVYSQDPRVRIRRRHRRLET